MSSTAGRYNGLRRSGRATVRRAHAVLGSIADGTPHVVLRVGAVPVTLTPSEAASVADSLIDVAEQVEALDAGVADGGATTTTTTPGATVPGSTN